MGPIMLVDAYSNAAGSCSGPRGGHGRGGEGNGGFVLNAVDTVDKKEGVENGAVVKLKLRGDKPFRGFLIKLSEDKGTLGDLEEGTAYKACYGREKTSVLHHTNAKPSDSLSFTWTAPKEGSGRAKIQAFVVTTMRGWYDGKHIAWKVKYGRRRAPKSSEEQKARLQKLAQATLAQRSPSPTPSSSPSPSPSPSPGPSPNPTSRDDEFQEL